MNSIERALRWMQWGVGRLSVLMGTLATICIVVITVATLAEIFLRYVFGRSLLGVIELVEILMAFIFFALMSYTQFLKGHLRLTVFIEQLPARVVLPLETLVLLIVLIFVTVMGWQAWSDAIIAVERQQIRFGAVEYPLWPAKLAAATAVAVAGLQLLADFLDRLAAMTIGDTPTAPMGKPASESDSA